MRKTAMAILLVALAVPASSDEKIVKTVDSSGHVVFSNAPAQKTTVARNSARNVYKWRDASGRVVYGYLNAAPPHARVVRIDQTLEENTATAAVETDAAASRRNAPVQPRPPVIRPLIHAVETVTASSGADAAAYRTTDMAEAFGGLRNASRIVDDGDVTPDSLPGVQTRYGSWPVIGHAVVLFLALIGLGVLVQKVLLTPWQRSTMQDPSNEEGA